jgi:hypothetical protein
MPHGFSGFGHGSSSTELRNLVDGLTSCSQDVMRSRSDLASVSAEPALTLTAAFPVMIAL